MTQRLSGFVHGQRRSLSDVAHELSSPVARMQAALGILEQRVEGSPHRYVVDALEDLQHMSGLINGLLLFSKAQIGVSSLQLEPANVVATVRRVMEREAPEVAITVADNGPGLPESELDQVFKPFYRPEFARQRETGGVGLGLASQLHILQLERAS